MKRFSEQLHKKSLTVKLRAAEKRELRERVVSYMEYHPLPAEMKVVRRKTTQPKPKKVFIEDFKEVTIPFRKIAQGLGAFAILILVAMPFAAERSVPGDGLYAVKRFNEEVRGTLVFTTAEKVEWETKQLNRRIAEARLLASEGRLTDEVEAEVAAAVRTHSENAQRNIDELRTKDADEATLAAIALETTLSVQSATLQDDTAAVAGTNIPKQPSILATAVEESRVKTTATNASSTIPTFDKLMARVEQNTTRVFELRNSIADTASSTQVAEISRRIEDIERSVAQAVSLQTEQEAEARALLIDSLQRTQKLIVLMTDIIVSETVDIERIVPVVLTPEEERTILGALQDEVDEKTAIIREVLQQTDDEALIEKVDAVVLEVDGLLSQAASSSAFIATRDTLETALGLVNNVYTLLELHATEEVVEEGDIVLPIATSSATTTVATSTTEVAEEESESETEGFIDEADAKSITDNSGDAATTTELSTPIVDTE